MKRFSEQLLAARKASGLTQEQLAELMNVSRPMISHWETGRTQPDIDGIKRLARILQYNFMDDDEEEQQPPPAAPDEPPTPPAPQTPKRHPWGYLLAFLGGALLIGAILLITLLPMRQEADKNEAAGTLMLLSRLGQGQSMVQVHPIDWYKQPNVPAENQAYLDISTTENPLRAIKSSRIEGGAGWEYACYFDELNGIDFTVTEYSVTRFYTDTEANTFVYDADAVRAFWGGSNVIPGGGQQLTVGRLPLTDVLGIGILISGTDAQGNALAFRYYIALSQEINAAATDVPATETPAAATPAPTETATARPATAAPATSAPPESMPPASPSPTAPPETARPAPVTPSPTYKEVYAHQTEARQMVKVPGIEWYTQTRAPVAGQAYLEMSAQEQPLRAFKSDQYRGGAGWYYYCTVQELGGVDFTVQECLITEFSANGRAYNATFSAEVIKTWWGSNVIPAGDNVLITGGFSYSEMLGVGVILRGKDANGNELEFHHYIELSMEIME